MNLLSNMNDKLKLHKSTERLVQSLGLIKRVVNKPDEEASLIDYLHCDDYYMFIGLQTGVVSFKRDFVKEKMSGPALFCVAPGQMHGLLDANDVNGWLLIVNALCVSQECIEQLEKISSGLEKMSCSNRELEILEPLLDMLEKRFSDPKAGYEVTRSLLNSFVLLFTELMLGNNYLQEKKGKELVTRFKALVVQQYVFEKSASAYAEQLHVSTEYLNAVIKQYTGQSTSQYITSHVMLMAKDRKSVV